MGRARGVVTFFLSAIHFLVLVTLGFGYPPAMTKRPTPLAQRIQALLDERGWSQSELARRMDRRPSFVNKLMGPKGSPTRATIGRVALALGVPPSHLEPSLGGTSTYGDISRLGRMAGVEIDLMRAAMRGLARGRSSLLQATPETALRVARGKGDTRAFDSMLEVDIVQVLRAYDPECCILSEEGTVDDMQATHASSLTFVSDPFDRSSAFAAWLGRHRTDERTIGELAKVAPPKGLQGANAPTASITCVRRGRIPFSVTVDLLSGRVLVACAAMVRQADLERCPTPEDVATYGQDLVFDAARAGDRAVTYLGDSSSPEGQQREEAFTSLGFVRRQLPVKALRSPGGPARFAWLCEDEELNLGHEPAIVLALGEKLQEALAWIPVAIHGGLAVFELASGMYPAREGVLLAPPPDYSIFRRPEGAGGASKLRVDLDRLMGFANPLNYRCTLAVAHPASYAATTLRSMPNARELT